MKTPKKPNRLLADLKRNDPKKYLQLFGGEYQATIARPLNVSILIAGLLLVGISSYLKTGNRLFLFSYLITTLLIFLPYVAMRVKVDGLFGMWPVGCGTAYVCCNISSLAVYQSQNWHGLNQSTIVAIQILIPIVLSIMLVVPYIVPNIVANIFLAVTFYMIFRPDYLKMGVEIDNYIWQVWMVMTTITFILHFMMRSRVLSKLQTDEIECSAITTRKIFDSIDQAVFLIECDHKSGTIFVKAGIRSPLCKKILGFPDGEERLDFYECFLTRIQLDPSLVDEALGALSTAFGGSDLTWDFNISKLPRSLYFRLHEASKPRHLTISYVPMYNGDGEIFNVLINASDDTELLQAHAERQGQLEQINLIVEMVGAGRERLQKGLSLIILLIEQTVEALGGQNQNPKKASSEAFIPLHTSKGNARTLGLHTIAHEIHQAEGLLTTLRIASGKLAPHQIQLIIKGLDEAMQTIRIRLRQYHEAMDVLGWKLDEAETVSLPVASYKAAMNHDGWLSMRATVDAGQDSSGQIAIFLSPAFRRLADIQPVVEAAAKRVATVLGKLTPFVQCELQGIWVTTEAFDEIVKVCPHIITNMMDHGIEALEERARKGKSTAGRIHISKSTRNSSLDIVFKDDGRGLDINAISAKAKENNLYQEGMAAEELAELIFHPGFSTKAKTTELSGRGFGMIAVRKSMEDISGDANIELFGKTEAGLIDFAIVLTCPDSVIWR